MVEERLSGRKKPPIPLWAEWNDQEINNEKWVGTILKFHESMRIVLLLCIREVAEIPFTQSAFHSLVDLSGCCNLLSLELKIELSGSSPVTRGSSLNCFF